MKERLTDKDWHNTKFSNLNEREVLKRLWELENKIEQGTLVDLPCKVGDIVYVANDIDYEVVKCKVDSIKIESNGFKKILLVSEDSKFNVHVSFDMFKYYCRYTESEAEARLKELKGKKG